MAEVTSLAKINKNLCEKHKCTKCEKERKEDLERELSLIMFQFYASRIR